MSLATRSALIIGAGGLGCPSAVALAAAGIGRLLIVDDDRVDETNLSRQMVFTKNDLGLFKAPSLGGALSERFGGRGQSFIGLDRRFEPSELFEVLINEINADLVLDCSDNFATRFAANDFCVKLGKPLIHGAAIRWQGQVLTILPSESACLRCVFESEPPPGAAPTCAEAGVISPLVGVIGGWMAQAAIDVLTRFDAPPSVGEGETAIQASFPFFGGTEPERRRSDGRMEVRASTIGALRTLDAWTGRERLIPVGQDPDCPACGKRRA